MTLGRGVCEVSSPLLPPFSHFTLALDFFGAQDAYDNAQGATKDDHDNAQDATKDDHDLKV
jgi:hypothetical protein